MIKYPDSEDGLKVLSTVLILILDNISKLRGWDKGTVTGESRLIFDKIYRLRGWDKLGLSVVSRLILDKISRFREWVK